MTSADCWAVGNFEGEDRNQGHLLIEHWDGTSWVVVPADPSVELGRPEDIHCLFTDNCWVVGRRFDSPKPRTLAEHWDGRAWTVVSTPNSATATADELHSLACTSSADCWAVGLKVPARGIPAAALIEHWDGEQWSIAANPANPATGMSTALFGVTCFAASDCRAVGDDAARWDGTRWSFVATPKEQDKALRLTDISCISSSDCWAVGHKDPAEAFFEALAEHWDGLRWTVVPTAVPGSGYSANIVSVDCTSSSSCWAVGFFHESGPGTLGLRWDGTSWTTQTMEVPALVASPTSGSPGTEVTVSGWGFLLRGETVDVVYKTGLDDPKSVPICSAIATYKAFSCTGTIPSASTAGARGAHAIVARGATSTTRPKVTFTLT